MSIALGCIANTPGYDFRKGQDNGQRADDQQPPKVSIALFGDAVEPVLAASRVLLWHQSDPGSKTAYSR
jgi:hypothetical protein